MARLSGTKRLDRRTLRQLLGRRTGETSRIPPAKPRLAEGLQAHQSLEQKASKTGLTESSAETVQDRQRRKRTGLSGNHGKAADPAPGEECTRPKKPLRVRKTVQNRRIDLSAADLDRRNRRRRPISGEASPRQRCHCPSTLVSPWKDVGAVTAEHTGY